MILLFPRNRIETLLSLVECDFVERWTALAQAASTVLAGPDERAGAALTLLEARRSYLTDIAARHFEMWLGSVAASAEGRENCAAAICETLQRVSESTGQLAMRKLYALVFTLLAVLRMAGWSAEGRRDASCPSRLASAGDLFLIARASAAVCLVCSQRRAQDIRSVAGFTGRRYLLPLPRSAFPALRAA